MNLIPLTQFSLIEELINHSHRSKIYFTLFLVCPDKFFMLANISAMYSYDKITVGVAL